MPQHSLTTTPSDSVHDVADGGVNGRTETLPSRAGPRPTAPTTGEGDRLVARTVVRETARSAAAATRQAATCAWARRAGVREEASAEPSAELVRLLAHLQATVAGYVHERREAGGPVERVLPEVKALVREASALERWFDPADALMAQVVRWTITAFYDEPELAHVPRFS